MSKKSKKKKALKREREIREKFGKGRKKNKEKLNKKLYGKPVKATLGEKQAKKLSHTLEGLSDVPALKEPRRVCNHQGKKKIAFVALENYEGETFIVKNLDKMATVFGEENVGVCEKCHIAVPELACIDVEDLDRAHMVLVGAVEHIVTRTDDRKEVELLHKAIKSFEEDLRVIRKKFIKTKERGVYAAGKVDREDLRTRPNRDAVRTTVRQRETKVTVEGGSYVDGENIIFTNGAGQPKSSPVRFGNEDED